MSEIDPEPDFTNVNVLKEHWPDLDREIRTELFWKLPRQDSEELFLSLGPDDQIDLIIDLPFYEKRSWIRLLALDDLADLIQRLEPEQKDETLLLLDDHSRREVRGLLAYAEDDAGGLMNPQYIRLRPDMRADEAIRYLRAQARTQIETIYYAYVLDSEQKLKGVVSFRDLLLAPSEKTVAEIMVQDFASIPEEMDREEVSRLMSQHDLMAIPVLDPDGRMKGIVTIDDVVTVVEKETTEDIQKLGGMEALDAPYFKVGFFEMLKKRAGWLIVLFVGGMFTATAMARYESEIARAVFLAIFIPLIISSGGNSGSQISTLIIRSLALREINLRDWGRVLFREAGAGVVLGLILGSIGLLRVVLWNHWSPETFGEHYWLVAAVVALSLVGVVLWGTIMGSMLPFILRRLNLDPASASAPLIATLVDVTGLIIYFSVASFLLSGTIL